MFELIDEKIQGVFSRGTYGKVLPSVVQGIGLILSLVLFIAMFWVLYFVGPFSINLPTVTVNIWNDGPPGIFEWITLLTAHFLLFVLSANVLSRHGVFKREYTDDCVVRLTFLFVGLFCSIFYGVEGDVYNTIVSSGFVLYAIGSYMREANTKT